MGEPRIGGLPLVTLHAAPVPGRPSIVEAQVLPGRGFMLLQAMLALPSGEHVELLHAPSPAEAAAALDGGPDDFAGNKAFSFGGALLLPYANRIRGRAIEPRRLATQVNGRDVELPRNWGGRAPGAETYAMHGLILEQAIAFVQPAPNIIEGRWTAADFGGRWPGQADIGFRWGLEGGALRLNVQVRNIGSELLPIGIGWHPYLRVPSGDRAQARLVVPAAARAEVNNYDEVLPTGRLSPVRATAYDFTDPGGRALGDLYLDDCFTDLTAISGRAAAELHDPAAKLRLRLTFDAPPVRAVQVYAPPDQPFVVIEPQFNLADPFGGAWPAEVDTGMVQVSPGGLTRYDVQLAATVQA